MIVHTVLPFSSKYYISNLTFQGLKYVNFPYLLTLQMLRFDFDYTSLQRIKLNDR